MSERDRYGAYRKYAKLPPFSLKPCPFCGGIPAYGNWAGGGGVWCEKCGAKIFKDHKITHDELVIGGEIAAEAWNRRVKDEQT